jgi:hypothetical protein
MYRSLKTLTRLKSVGAGQGKQLTTADHGVLLGRREVVMIDVLRRAARARSVAPQVV